MPAFFGLFASVVFLLLSVGVPGAHAVDECGASPWTARYTAFTASPTTPYAAGTIVSTGTGGALQLWEWTSGVTSTTAPTTGNNRGWTEVTDDYASQKVDCDNSDTFTAATEIVYPNSSTDNLAIIYDRDGTGGATDTVRLISLRGGDVLEVHIEDGSLSRPATGVSYNRIHTVDMILDSDGEAIRFSMASGTSVTSAATTSNGALINLYAGAAAGADITVDIAGNTSNTTATNSPNLNVGVSGAGNIDVDITGGTHTARGENGYVVIVSAANAADTGTIDVDITGAGTVLSSNGGASSNTHASRAVIVLRGGDTGANTLTIGAGALVCASATFTAASGSTAATCPNPTHAVYFQRRATSTIATGTSTLNNSGTIWGTVTGESTAKVAFVNTSTGRFFGSLALGGGIDSFTNSGTWTMSANSNFGGGTDTFTNAEGGNFIVYYSGSEQHMVGLENFILQAGSTTTFSLPNVSTSTLNALSGPRVHSAILRIRDATPTLAGTVTLVTRSGTLPTSGKVRLIRGQDISYSTDLSDLTVALTGARGHLTIEDDYAGIKNVVLHLMPPALCGDPTSRTVVPPGRANMEVVCDASDTLTAASDVVEFQDRLAVVYSGGETPIRSINHRGFMGEIHILSGSVVRPDDDTADSYDAVLLGLIASSGNKNVTTPLRLAAQATEASGGLTRNQVFARDRAVRVTLASGAEVKNEDPHGMIGSQSSGHAIAVNAWGGDVHMDIAGNTYGAYAGIRAITGLGGSVDININGGVHRALRRNTIDVWVRPLLASDLGYPTGVVDIDIGSGARLSAESESNTVIQSVIKVGAEWAYSDPGSGVDIQPDDLLHTVDIARGAVVCRGTFNSAGQCEIITGIKAEAMRFAATGSKPQTGGAAPIFQVTNEGQIYGRFLSDWNTRGVRVINKGFIRGIYYSGSACGAGDRDFGGGCVDGPDILVNEAGATWVMTTSSNFGSGMGDSLTNSGTLVFRSRRTIIELQGLETFTQTAGGVIRVEIDPRAFVCPTTTPPANCRPSTSGLAVALTDSPQASNLPTSAIIDFGSASGTVLGRLEVVLLDTSDEEGGLSQAALQELVDDAADPSIALITGGDSLTLTGLQLGGGVSRDSAGAISYNVEQIPVQKPIAFRQPVLAGDRAIAHIYDSVVQFSWFASHSIWDKMVASGCSVENAASQLTGILTYLDGGCGWANVGGRFSSHERETLGAEETEENVFALSGGFQAPVMESAGHMLSVGVSIAYEYADMELEKATSEGNRVLVGLGASSIGTPELPVNVFLGLSINSGTYEVSRSSGGSTFTSEPEILIVGGHGGIEYLVPHEIEPLGEIMFVPRIQMDIVGIMMDGFTETSNGVTVGELKETLVSFTPALEFRRLQKTPWGDLQSWLDVGLLLFARSPKLEYEVSDSRFEGTMGGVFAEISAGVNMLYNDQMEFALYWDGIFSEDTLSNAVSFKAKYAF